jgi:ZIP family zinc transporter
MNLVLLGFLASLAAGSATALGALPALAVRRVPDRLQDALLGFAAGVMLSASFFSLILPSLDAAGRIYGGTTVAAAIAVVGIVLGVAALALINEYAPHEHFVLGHEGPPTASLRRIWLFVVAITIHNFPEGLAVGVGFGSGDVENGVSLAIGIGLQNMPEGLAVAVALTAEGYTRLYAVLIAALTGLVEPVGGLLGAGMVTVAEPLLPWGLAFAAGAMLYVISHEIIPETHRRGFENEATTGLTIGLTAMLFLDVTLG